jgi:hypothetical protein
MDFRAFIELMQHFAESFKEQAAEATASPTKEKLLMVDWLPAVPHERRIPDERDFSQRRIPAQYVVVHTTGAGIVQKAFDNNKKSAQEVARYACSYYARSGNNVSTHLLIDWDGLVWQVLPLTVRGWHAGWKAKVKDLYSSTEWQRWSHPLGGSLTQQAPSGSYQAWKDRFPELSSPKDLLPAGADSPNSGSISVDLLAVAAGGPWTDAQKDTLNSLTLELCERMNVPRSDRTVLAHSFLDPMRRMTKKRGSEVLEEAWDPKNWEDLWPTE